MQTTAQDKPEAETPRAGRKTRLHYLDWLRVLAVLGVFVYHTLQPFSNQEWHVKNDQLSGSIDAVVSFIDPWGVAFFFMIAGASGFLALRWRSTGGYVRERLMRVLVPLVVAYLLLSPVQAFIEARHYGQYTGSFIAGIPLFFSQVYSELGQTVFHPLLVDRTYHLWFVVFLLWFAFLGLPVFLWLRAHATHPLLTWVGEHARWRGSTLLLSIPLAVMPLVVLPLFPASEDWGTFVYLFGFFVAGGLVFSDQRLTHAIERDVVLAAVVALCVDAVMLLTGVPQFIAAWSSAPSYSLTYVWSYLLVAVQAWAWVSFLVGMGMRARWFRRPLPNGLAAAAMPFFLLHQPVILAIAFFVVQWNAGILPKWITIALVSFAVSAALAAVVARLPVISTMFGVKPRTRLTRSHRNSALPSAPAARQGA